MKVREEDQTIVLEIRKTRTYIVTFYQSHFIKSLNIYVYNNLHIKK